MNETITLPPVQNRGETEHRHEPLTEEQLGGLLAAFGNHEGKALLLLAMQPDEYYGRMGLHNLHLGIQGHQPAFVGANSNQFDYASLSLEPIGAVTMARDDEGLKFGLSEYGRDVGRPVAALLLDFALEKRIPLNALLGSTAAKEGSDRAPLNRIKIYESLLTRDQDTTLAQIVQDTGLGKNIVSYHLKSLSDSGLLTAESTNNSSRIVISKLTEQGVNCTPKRPGSFAETVMQVIKEQDGVADMDTIVEGVRELLPENGLSASEFRSKINSTLRLFERQQLITRNTLDRNQFSKIELSSEQRERLEEFLNLITRIKAMDEQTITDGIILATTILESPGSVRDLVKQAYDYSPYANARSKVALGSMILRIVSEGSNEMTARDIREAIVETSTGKSLSQSRVDDIINRLVKMGKLTPTKLKGRINLYSITPDDTIDA